MLRRIDLRGSVPPPADLRSILPRADVDVDSVAHLVRPIVDDVAARGVPAVLEYTERFDRLDVVLAQLQDEERQDGGNGEQRDGEGDAADR